ncbi:IS110 family transposase, partial [Mesorhizobium sp. M4B.F.Ca.ET.089.01.1.1]
MSSNTIDHEHAIIIAIELSRSTWLVAARLPGVEKPRFNQIGAGDTAAL